MKTTLILILSFLSLSAFGAELGYNCTCCDSYGVCSFQPTDAGGSPAGKSPTHFNVDMSKQFCIYPDTTPDSKGGYQGFGWTCAANTQPSEAPTLIIECEDGDYRTTIETKGDTASVTSCNTDWSCYGQSTDTFKFSPEKSDASFTRFVDAGRVVQLEIGTRMGPQRTARVVLERETKNGCYWH